MKIFRSVSLHVIFSAFLASGFPSGAPTDACFSMIPRHMDPVTNNQVLSQNSNSPFDISVDKLNFEIGEAVKVTIHGPPFKGLFLVAVEDKSNNMPAGRFYHENEVVKTISCSNKNDGITHTSDKRKDFVEVKWYGPDNSSNDEIHFRATVVVNMTTFWTDVVSKGIRRRT